ncbi:tRNA pseudouridine synthase [Hamiltosporidium tvaerminnensis]|uniref:tRNA pseudouridine synthase 1 n=1 Tax=Hamiltosporidium tvaerminnensis TaxID=1176355 RepID=A0A4Q9LBU3_9MICR|nr:tRNA pseudouridine synthase 1 [Hamiltosporidium tvaerminnensis]TBU04501.1 tRNA pseudouridine synthase [Hamiltosporidium tvaerminnensis]
MKIKIALIVGYVGTEYNGLQYNIYGRTIEGEIIKSLLSIKAITEMNAAVPRKIALHRSCRTDKGVHAVMNIIVCKVVYKIENEKFEELKNDLLSKNIYLYKIVRVTKGFDAKKMCQARTYKYILPAFILKEGNFNEEIESFLVHCRSQKNILNLESNNSTLEPNLNQKCVLDNEGYEKKTLDASYSKNNRINELSLFEDSLSNDTNSSNFLEEKNVQFQTEIAKDNPLITDSSQNKLKNEILNINTANTSSEKRFKEIVIENKDNISAQENEIFGIGSSEEKSIQTNEKFCIEKEDFIGKDLLKDDSIQANEKFCIKKEDFIGKDLLKDDSIQMNDNFGLEKDDLISNDLLKEIFSNDLNYKITEDDFNFFELTFKKLIRNCDFHNFTTTKNTKGTRRYIKDISVSKPFLYNDREYIEITIHGQSFMLHQIRKMVGFVILITKYCRNKSDEIINMAFSSSKINVPKSPAEYLFLDTPFFDFYNKKFGKLYSEISLDESEKSKFKEVYILPNIHNEENIISLLNWIRVIYKHGYHFEFLK